MITDLTNIILTWSPAGSWRKLNCWRRNTKLRMKSIRPSICPSLTFDIIYAVVIYSTKF